MIGAIILAAGRGERYGKQKQFETVNGKPIIQYAIESVKSFCDDMVVVLPEDNKFDYFQGIKAVEGGPTRYDSTVAGYEKLNPKCDCILIVDAVRCNTSRWIIKDLLAAALNNDYDFAFPAIKSTDTVCLLKENKVAAIDKRKMYNIQTPTAMKSYVIDKIIDAHLDKDLGFWFGYMALIAGPEFRGKAVRGNATNIKITYPVDLKVFEALLGEK